MQNNPTSRILIYRLGSIGDFVVSLPCLHLIRRRYPAATVALLTNESVESRAAPAASVLDGTGLIDSYIRYPVGARRPDVLHGIVTVIRNFKPDLLVYLASRPEYLRILRDWLFFRLAGVKREVGFPFARDQRRCLPRAGSDGLWEAEADRMARCIAALGPAETARPESWDLHLSQTEHAEAARLLDLPSAPPRQLIGLGIGTKQPINDWGDDNWRAVLSALQDRDTGLVLIGSGEESERASAVASLWPGPVFNLCGRASPRVSAAAIKRVGLFLCHDSGPMHLASAVGTRCVAVFSRHDLPGQWFPFGEGNRNLYPYGGNSIRAIRPESVIEAALATLAARPTATVPR